MTFIATSGSIWCFPSTRSSAFTRTARCCLRDYRVENESEKLMCVLPPTDFTHWVHSQHFFFFFPSNVRVPAWPYQDFKLLVKDANWLTANSMLCFAVFVHHRLISITNSQVENPPRRCAHLHKICQPEKNFLQGEEKEVISTINSWHFRCLTDTYSISSYSKVAKYSDLTPNV